MTSTLSRDSIASEAAASLDALLEAALDAIVVIDERGVIRTFSPAAERLFGFEGNEILGERIDILMPEPHRSAHQGYIERYLRTGRARIIGKGRKVEGRRRDGSTFPAYLAIGEAVIEGRRLFVGVVHDLTEQTEAERRRAEESLARRRAEHEAEQLRASLAQLERLGLIEGMATSVAHEVAQPMAAIFNYTETCRALLRRGALDEAKLEEMLDKIAASARLARDVVEHVRGFVRDRDRRARPVGVEELVRDAVALAELPAQRLGVRIETEVEADLPPIDVDAVQIQQVLVNLLVNATEAMRDSDSAHRRLRLRVARRGPAIHVQVVDSGTSIAPEIEDELFRPFKTTKADGLGLGLSICRSILDAHRGRIWFERNPDRGTTFHVTLPSASPAPTAPER